MGKTTFSGPVAGAYVAFQTTVGAGTATKTMDGLIPTGMIFRMFAISVFQRTGGSCALIVGTTASTQGYLTTLNFAPDISSYKLLDGALVSEGGTIDLVGGTDEIICNFGGTLTDPTSITFHGYIVGHTSDLNADGV